MYQGTSIYAQPDDSESTQKPYYGTPTDYSRASQQLKKLSKAEKLRLFKKLAKELDYEVE